MSLPPDEHGMKQEDDFDKMENLSYHLGIIWCIVTMMASMRGNASQETLDNGYHVILETIDRIR